MLLCFLYIVLLIFLTPQKILIHADKYILLHFQVLRYNVNGFIDRYSNAYKESDLIGKYTKEAYASGTTCNYVAVSF